MNKKENKFEYCGRVFKAPLSLKENIREWILNNKPDEYQVDFIPSDTDFSSLDNALSSSTTECPLWYQRLDTYLCEVIYCCIEAVKHPATDNSKKVKVKNQILNEKRKEMGESIRAMRTAQGWEQEQLAEIAGITAANLRSIEAGKYATTLDVLNKIARALNAELRIVEI